MNGELVACLLFVILCSRALFACSHPPSISQGTEKETSLLCEQEKRSEMMFNHALLLNSTKAAKGKGAYGGANVVHHPRNARSNAPPRLPTRPIWFFESASIGFLYALIF